MTIKDILLLPVRVSVKIAKAGISALKGGIETKKAVDTMRSAEKILMLFFMGDHYMTVEGRMTKDLQYISPKNINRLFKVEKIYKNFDTAETMVVVYNDFPETIDIDKPPTIDEFERLIVDKEKIKNKDVETTVNMEKFYIKGGKVLTAMAYNIYKHNLLQFLDSPVKSELIYLMIIVFVIAGFLGFIGGGFSVALVILITLGVI